MHASTIDVEYSSPSKAYIQVSAVLVLITKVSLHMAIADHLSLSHVLDGSAMGV